MQKADLVAEVRVDVHYRAGHSSSEVWELLEIYCPECGKKRVWRETSEGDYYVGPTYLCVACGAGGQILFQKAWITPDSDNDYDEQRLTAIRAALERKGEADAEA